MSVISDAEARNLWRNGRAKRSDLDEQHQLRQVGEKIEVEDGAWHEQGAGGVSKQLYNIAVRAGSPTVPNLRPLSPSSIMLDENQFPTSMEGYTQLATTPLHPSVAALQGRDRNQPHAALSTPTQPTRTADPAGFSHDQLSGSLTPHGMGPVLKKEAWSPEASPPLPPPPVRSPPDGVLSPESVEGWSPAIKSVVAPHVLGSVVAPEAPALPEGLPQPAPPGHPGAPAGRGAAPAQRSLEQIRAGADGQHPPAPAARGAHPSAPAARGGPPGPPGPWPNWRPVMCLALFRPPAPPSQLHPQSRPQQQPQQQQQQTQPQPQPQQGARGPSSPSSRSSPVVRYAGQAGAQPLQLPPGAPAHAAPGTPGALLAHAAPDLEPSRTPTTQRLSTPTVTDNGSKGLSTPTRLGVPPLWGPSGAPLPHGAGHAPSEEVTLPDSPESGDSSEGRGSSLSSPASSPCSPVARRLLGRPFAEAGDGAAHASPGSPSVARAPPGSREGSAQPEMCAEIGVRAHGAAFARLSPERAAGTAPLLLPGGPGATSSDLFAQARLLGKADAEAAAQRARGTPPARPRAQQGAGGLASGEGAADDANQGDEETQRRLLEMRRELAAAHRTVSLLRDEVAAYARSESDAAGEAGGLVEALRRGEAEAQARVQQLERRLGAMEEAYDESLGEAAAERERAAGLENENARLAAALARAEAAAARAGGEWAAWSRGGSGAEGGAEGGAGAYELRSARALVADLEAQLLQSLPTREVSPPPVLSGHAASLTPY